MRPPSALETSASTPALKASSEMSAPRTVVRPSAASASRLPLSAGWATTTTGTDAEELSPRTACSWRRTWAALPAMTTMSQPALRAAMALNSRALAAAVSGEKPMPRKEPEIRCESSEPGLMMPAKVCPPPRTACARSGTTCSPPANLAFGRTEASVNAASKRTRRSAYSSAFTTDDEPSPIIAALLAVWRSAASDERTSPVSESSRAMPSTSCIVFGPAAVA